jgi:hypothetical protein
MTKTYVGQVYREVTVSVSFPPNWSLTPKPVTSLVLPRQAFAVSSSVLPATHRGSDQWWPDISALSSSDVTIWCYYSKPLGLEAHHESPIPDYGSSSIPLTYEESTVEPQYTSRGWATKFLKRRWGVNYRDGALTVEAWEGLTAPEQTVMAASGIVSSIRVW